MRWLAEQFGIRVAEETWPTLARAASFEAMRARADRLVPTAGIFKDNAAFFRRGTSDARVAQLAPPDLLTWLHPRRKDR
jgi:aryl sulfotransferase